MDRFPRQEGTKRARALRQRSTPQEELLWRHLRAGRMLGVKFKRQQPLGFYIADFVALERKLIVEVDGSQHAGSNYDTVRDAELTARGFRILRFWNNEVTDNLEGVLERIAGALR
ncbi:endonuclease domain-containing protein [Deinococcus sp. MIMF12]|uniref:Endonuclease domain-containing protein n=1 Tax=Deinococcus rhizophilus TaxID=3049544 RepID=A0ABT7JHG4_9DEIO|nr:endonuclease domain-containing protein [Deinococcus rhizophilus]MDL2344500.1 endonuclease domain-containing protein [Deinococcus rhizophilus]